MRHIPLAICTLLVVMLVCSCSKEGKPSPHRAESPSAPATPPRATCDKAVSHGLNLCAKNPECAKYINSGTLSTVLNECHQKYRDNEKLLNCVLAVERIENAQDCLDGDLAQYRLPESEKGIAP